MFPTKAPGPDGFPAHFFQRHWDLCGEEVTHIVLRVLKGDDDPTSFNKTFIVLIPKVPKPKDLGQFRKVVKTFIGDHLRRAVYLCTWEVDH
jgi:hypothetical protein